ncbi:DUF6302 family protein [Streptomyces sp. NPDC097610]|uniref:DUF6302 family protein n=1 Tax=Streptomyces sp. NPDC097610 TaxID=3157227 RepID=UPI00331D0805
MSTRTYSSLKVPAPRLLPPEQAYDYEFWVRRLVDSELVHGAVAVALFRAPLLAVPTGATRRGGQLHMVEEVFARQTVAALEGLPGFVQLSYRGPIVEWGDKPPAFGRPGEFNQFYGLRDPAEEPDGARKPPAGHRGHGLETGRWPPSSEQLSGRNPPPCESVPTVAAALP